MHTICWITYLAVGKWGASICHLREKLDVEGQRERVRQCNMVETFKLNVHVRRCEKLNMLMLGK